MLIIRVLIFIMQKEKSMKTFFVTLAFALSGAVMNLVAQQKNVFASGNDTQPQYEALRKSAEASTQGFITAGDQRNVPELEKLLHTNFRTVAKLPGAAGVVPIIESRAQYLTMIQEGKLGGKPRMVKSLSVEVWNATAVAHVEMESTELRFSSTFSLFHSAEMGWQIVHDLVELQVQSK